MIDYQGEKFKKYLNDHNISVAAMAESLGVSRQTVYQYFSTKSLTREIVSRITYNLGLDESDIWDEVTKTHDSNHYYKESVSVDYGAKLNSQKTMEEINDYINPNDKNILEITPVYDRHITANKISSLWFGNEKVTPDLILLNGEFKDCDLVIRHTDPALNGFLDEKSFIGLKEIKKESYTKRIIPGKAYVIVLDNLDVIERFVHPGITKAFLLRGVNHESDPDFEIGFDEILELWLMKVSIPVFEAKPL